MNKEKTIPTITGKSAERLNKVIQENNKKAMENKKNQKKLIIEMMEDSEKDGMYEDKELTEQQLKNVKRMVEGTFGKEAVKDKDILQLYIDCHLTELEQYSSIKLSEYKEQLIGELEERKKKFEDYKNPTISYKDRLMVNSILRTLKESIGLIKNINKNLNKD